MSGGRLLAPAFVDMLVLTGECIDPAGINAVAPQVPGEVRREHREQVRRAQRGEGPDYMPVSSDLRWWFVERWHAGTLDRDLEGVDIDSLGLQAIGEKPVLYRVEFE